MTWWCRCTDLRINICLARSASLPRRGKLWRRREAMKVFKLPDLGEGLREAEIVEWHVRSGEEVRADQPMLSVETAKAIVEIPSPQSGRIAKLFGQPGDIVHLGAPLVSFEGADDEADAGTVVGHMEVGQHVVPEAPAASGGMGAGAGVIKA